MLKHLTVRVSGKQPETDCTGRLPIVSVLYSMFQFKSAAGWCRKSVVGQGVKNPSRMTRSLIYLHLCQGEGLRQKPSGSSAPSALHSDSGLVSSDPGSRRGRHGHHRGNHLQRGKDRNDLGGEEKRKEDTRKTDRDSRGGQRDTRV